MLENGFILGEGEFRDGDLHAKGIFDQEMKSFKGEVMMNNL